MLSKNILIKLVAFNKQRRLFSSRRLGILGAPLRKGQFKHGVEDGPSAIRKAGLVEELVKLGIDVKDFDNVDITEFENDLPFGKVKFPLSVGAACEKISDAVKKVLEEGRQCLTLGGDHSLGMGSVYGHSQVHSDLCLLWVDAHSDINTEFTTLTGNMHGMPCSFLIKELQKYRSFCPGFSWLKPCVNKQNVAYIGLRDVDPLEKLILTKEGIIHYSMKDVDHLGILEVTSRALEAINPRANLSLHVSFDIDSIDKASVPSTTIPVYGGLTVREALVLAEEVFKSGNLNAVDVVEINQNIGNNEQVNNTLEVAVLVVKTFFGYCRAGNLPENINAIPVE